MHVLYIDPLSDETKILLGGKKKRNIWHQMHKKIHVQMLFKEYGAIIIKFGPFVAFDVFFYVFSAHAVVSFGVYGGFPSYVSSFYAKS